MLSTGAIPKFLKKKDRCNSKLLIISIFKNDAPVNFKKQEKHNS